MISPVLGMLCPVKLHAALLRLHVQIQKRQAVLPGKFRNSLMLFIAPGACRGHFQQHELNPALLAQLHHFIQAAQRLLAQWLIPAARLHIIEAAFIGHCHRMDQVALADIVVKLAADIRKIIPGELLPAGVVFHPGKKVANARAHCIIHKCIGIAVYLPREGFHLIHKHLPMVFVHVGVAVHRIHFQHQNARRLADERLLDAQPCRQRVLAWLAAGKACDTILMIHCNRRYSIIKIAVADHNDIQRMIGLPQIAEHHRIQGGVLRLIVAGNQHHGTQLEQQQKNQGKANAFDRPADYFFH